MSLLTLMLTVLLQSTGVSAAADAVERHFAAPAAPSTQRVSPKPLPDPRMPAERTCATPMPQPTCGGAIGFCPEFRCVDGKWVDVRSKRRAPGAYHEPRR